MAKLIKETITERTFKVSDEDDDDLDLDVSEDEEDDGEEEEEKADRRKPSRRR